MAKKRKTRAQKERAAIRQQQQRGAEPKVTTEKKAVNITSKEPSPILKKPDPSLADTKSYQHQKRTKAMLLSLKAFGVLIILQLLVWSLDYIGLISIDIFNF